MQAQVKTWGNSQGIRIPKEVLQEAAFSVNDVLDVKVSNGMIVLVKPLAIYQLMVDIYKFPKFLRPGLLMALA